MKFSNEGESGGGRLSAPNIPHADIDSVAFWAWREFLERRVKETTWRPDLSGTPGNMAIDQFMFTEGFKKGVDHALQKRT
jgi:hypothetical protein